MSYANKVYGGGSSVCHPTRRRELQLSDRMLTFVYYAVREFWPAITSGECRHMGVKHRLVTIGAGVLITAGGAIAAAPIASAVSYTPAAGGGVVHLNPGEARAVHDARVGGAVDALLPQYGRSQSGRTLGQGVEFYSGQAASLNRNMHVDYRTLPGGTRIRISTHH